MIKSKIINLVCPNCGNKSNILGFGGRYYCNKCSEETEEYIKKFKMREV